MSSSLGPIHYWLYNKIKIQNDIVEDIVSLDRNNNLELNLKNKLDQQFGETEIRALEEIIDISNIHGWLQQKVSQVEYKLAYAVTKILDEKVELFEDIKTIFKNKGSEMSLLDNTDDIKKYYKTINDYLLDGMPCDNANSIVSEDENQIIWHRNVCVHGDYWQQVGGDINNYYKLRDEFILGLLDNTNVSYEKSDSVTSKIYRS
jgi:hypothetical protein